MASKNDAIQVSADLAETLTIPAAHKPEPAATVARPRILLPARPTLRLPALRPLGPEVDGLTRRYSREAQLALEGLFYLGARLPFRMLAVLVEAGRHWEEEYNRPGAKRRVPFEDDGP